MSLIRFGQIERRIADATSLDEFASVLEMLLTRGYDVWVDGSLYEIRQLPSGITGLRVDVSRNGRTAAEFRVRGNAINATFSVLDGSLKTGNADDQQLRIIWWWYMRGRNKLIDALRAN